jgi:hypothetical protein
MVAAHHRPMMTQQLGFSVLTAPIAAIDRRALSQAWYSALHLARESRAPEASQHPAIAQRDALRKPAASSPRGSTVVRGGTKTVQSEAKASRRDPLPQERRSMRSPLARKIEHLFLRPNTAATRATFTIDGTDARVQVSMQQTRAGLQLIAVCSPRSRAYVAQALEQARYALAARGIALDARITE